MKTQKVSATNQGRRDEGLDPVVIDFDFPETVKEAVSVYGEAVVLSNLIASVRIGLQGAIRAKFTPKRKGETYASVDVSKIQRELKDWKPSVAKAAKTAVEKAADQLAKLSDEERKALIKALL